MYFVTICIFFCAKSLPGHNLVFFLVQSNLTIKNLPLICVPWAHNNNLSFTRKNHEEILSLPGFNAI